MRLVAGHYLGLISSVLIVALTIIFIDNLNLKIFIITLGLILGILPFLVTFLIKQSRQREKEEKFLEFSRDLVENVKSGTPISKSIINLRNRNYGTLSPHIEKLANQLSIGFPLNDALKNFARDTKNSVIKRAVSMISEAERAGGEIDKILESVSASVNQIENLQKERKSAVSNLITQGYLIFFIFIIIMLVMEFKIFPLVSKMTTSEGISVTVQAVTPEQFSMPLFFMILIQSFFAGIIIGKISEGSIKSGIKHSFILISLTLIITTGARALFG